MIPYYAKNAGIKLHTSWEPNRFYVVLDKHLVDALSVGQMDIFFDAVVQKCANELGLPLLIDEYYHALSPSYDETYVVNFVAIAKSGEVIQ